MNTVESKLIYLLHILAHCIIKQQF